MSTAPADFGELRIELADPNELFDPRRADVANGLPALPPGIDRIRRELSAGTVRDPGRLAILLPSQHVNAATERGLREAVGRYCELGIKRVEQELKTIHREEIQALAIGLAILAVSLALAQLVLNSGWPMGIRDFFGNGLFLVAAWVGMWYPLELLIYAARPHRSERKLLRTLSGLEVAVQASAAVRLPGS